MIAGESEYRQALEELQQYLDAKRPPAIGSTDFVKFEGLLEKIEAYESTLAGIY